MNRAAAFSLLIFLGSIASPAQSSGLSATRPTVLHMPPVSTGCPIGMRAQHLPGLGAVIATKGNPPANRPAGPVQVLQLTLSNTKPKEVVGAQITVHGFTRKGRLTPARSAQTEPGEITTTINIKLTVGAKEDASTELSLRSFTAVSLIELDSVNYSDGSAWRASDLQTCHVVPDGMMLISSR